MVNRFHVFGKNWEVRSSATGEWIQYDDYAALQAALKEALIKWNLLVNIHDKEGQERIAELRKQFLE